MIGLLIKASRWRFWSYLGGTYLVGYAAGASSLAQFACPRFWVHLAFFLFPGNLFLYGLNDLCDADTDSRNPRKGIAEVRLTEAQAATVRKVVVVVLAAGGVLAFFQSSAKEVLTLGTFFALSVAYSAPPLRFKARPVLDSASNILYAVPGFLGYQHAGGGPIPAAAVLTAALWTAAMHLFSAVPDVESDRAAGISTTATVLGPRASLFVCSALWCIFAMVILSLKTTRPWSLLACVYPAVPLVLAISAPDQARRVYGIFPILNAAGGAAAFFVLAGRL